MLRRDDQLKKAYQNSKINAESRSEERLSLARRELETIRFLINEIGYQTIGLQRVLDLGCGDGYLNSVCSELGWSYEGLDYSDANFETDQLPIENESIDVVLSLAVLEHLHNPSNFVTEIYRALKPGGVVVISTPNFQLDWRNFYNDPTHVRPYTPRSVEKLLKLAGFDAVSSFPGVRCKSRWWYLGSSRFLKAYFLLPFRGDTRWPVPSFLKGHARSIFALGLKPKSSAGNSQLT